MARSKKQVNYNSVDYKAGHTAGYQAAEKQKKTTIDNLNKAIENKNTTILNLDADFTAFVKGVGVVVIIETLIIIGMGIYIYFN